MLSKLRSHFSRYGTRDGVKSSPKNWSLLKFFLSKSGFQAPERKRTSDVVADNRQKMASVDVLLFISCLFHLIISNKAKRAQPRVTLDIPSDFHERMKVYYDFVEIIAAPSHAEAEFDIVLLYRTKEARLLSVEIISIGIEGEERNEFKYTLMVLHRSEKKQKLRVRVTLRDSLMYFENRALNIFPDLYVEQIHVTITLLDLLPGGLDSKPVLAGDFLVLPLTSPWRRPQKPGFSFSWPWEHLMRHKQRKIEKCMHLKGTCPTAFKFQAPFSLSISSLIAIYT